MANISLKLNDEQINKIKETFKAYIVESKNEYIDTLIQKENLTISIYNTKKVLFQGNDAFFYAESFIEKKNKRQAGSDEVGTGDYFGPVCVCACIVEEDDYELLNELGVNDSKVIDDKKILKIAPQLIERLKHSLLILDNETYNKIHDTNNLNQIKAKLHNQAYINMKNKNYDIPKASYVDQFAEETLYYSYLKDEKEIYHDLFFETKAESKYISVAAASIIARYAFINKIKKMENKYGLSFHKGAGDDVDKDAKNFVDKYGKDKLVEVCKLHFKNTEKII